MSLCSDSQALSVLCQKSWNLSVQMCDVHHLKVWAQIIIIIINPLTARVVWGTTDDFATSFLHFSLFSTTLWDLPNSRPVHSLKLSSHLFYCPPCLLPPFTVPCKMVLARPDERKTWPYHCSLLLFTIWSGDLRVVQLPAGSWHRLPHW